MRIIDADALKERFRKRIVWLKKDVHDHYSLGLYHGAETDNALIEEIPTIDAVLVVRCRDCKHGIVDDEDFPNQYLCNHNGCDWNDGEHYCSYGERREENEKIY